MGYPTVTNPKKTPNLFFSPQILCKTRSQKCPYFVTGILKTYLAISFGYKPRKTTNLFSRPLILRKFAVKTKQVDRLVILKTYSAISYKNKSRMKKHSGAKELLKSHLNYYT